MKIQKIFSAALISLTVFIWSGSVSADMIIEPYESSFYKDNSDSCTVEQYVRKYTVTENSALYKIPGVTLKNRDISVGDILDCNTYYTDDEGILWGYAYARDNEKGGWFKVSRTEVIYDHVSFVQEHEAEFAEYSGELGSLDFDENVYVWEYPGSEGLVKALPPAALFPENYGEISEQLDRNSPYVYTDSSSDKWVYVRSVEDGWLYVPDPCADLRHEGAASDTSFASENIEVYGNVTDIPAEAFAGESSRDFILPLLLAAFAAALSGAVISVTKKKTAIAADNKTKGEKQ